MCRLNVLAGCLLSLFISGAVLADEPEKAPSLQDAKTINEIYDWMQHGFDKKIDRNADEKQNAVVFAEIYMPAGEKALEIAKADWEKNRAYDMKFSAFRYQVMAGIEGAEQNLETFFNELAAKKELSSFVEERRFQLFADKARETVKTPEKFDAFKAEIKTWINRKVQVAYPLAPTVLGVAEQYDGSAEQFAAELVKFIQSAECTLSASEKKNAVEVLNHLAEQYRFNRFTENAEKTVNTPESFDAFKTELKGWIDRGYDVSWTARLGLQIAEKNKVPAETFVQELVKYVQSPECSLSETAKKQAAATLEGKLRTAIGSDLKLYGKTLDDQDFNWESLRGKYVLVKFTATWCGPCKGEIPGMLKAYEKYHDKGLEIVSVYVWEHGSDPVEMVKKHVEKEKLPWIIISEALTVPEEKTAKAAGKSFWGNVAEVLGGKAKPQGPQKQSEYYAISGVPTMLLVDKEGKIIMTEARGEQLQAKLAEIFK